MNTNKTTTDTRTNLEKLMDERNKLISSRTANNRNRLAEINTELVQTISQIAAFKTLKFLAYRNATQTTEVDTEEKKTFGYDMSVKLLKTLYFDIMHLKNRTEEEVLSDAIDLVQVASLAILPYFQSNVKFSLADTVYIKVLKNGNEKSYTVFSLACKSIREYITAQTTTRQFKKLHYVIGYTDNGTEITTTKRPKNDITDTDTEQRKTFISRYKLTEQEQTAILHLFDGLTTTETAEKMQISKRTVERALKSAREKIQAKDKRIAL